MVPWPTGPAPSSATSCGDSGSRPGFRRKRSRNARGQPRCGSRPGTRAATPSQAVYDPPAGRRPEDWTPRIGGIDRGRCAGAGPRTAECASCIGTRVASAADELCGAERVGRPWPPAPGNASAHADRRGRHGENPACDRGRVRAGQRDGESRMVRPLDACHEPDLVPQGVCTAIGSPKSVIVSRSTPWWPGSAMRAAWSSWTTASTCWSRSACSSRLCSSGAGGGFVCSRRAGRS